MSTYVRRTHPLTGRTSFTGPIRSRAQAEREASAWSEAGWRVMVEGSSTLLRTEIRRWERAREQRRYGLAEGFASPFEPTPVP